MRASTVVLAAVLGVFVASCSGSGGGGSTAGDNASCTTADCGRDDEGPSETPAPPENPLSCDDVQGMTCPPGYHCAGVKPEACDPATATGCEGTCVLGDALPRCGLNEQPCPDGYTCADDPADTCDGGPALDCPGVCRPVADGECAADADCPQLGAPCSICADGSVRCPVSTCDGGKCTAKFDACNEAQPCGGVSGLACPAGFECVDDPSDDCAADGGAADCRGICVPEQKPSGCDPATGMACPPGFECVEDLCPPDASGGGCTTVCKPVEGNECVTDGDCAAPASCEVCADGSASCFRAFCDAGRCNVVAPGCPPPAGCADDMGCPPGQICKREGNCDPATGAPECLGVCVPPDQPRSCGGIAGDTCPDGYACVDLPGDDCDPANGGADCPSVCEPEPPPPCVSDEDCGPKLPLPCPICPDGSSACPHGECTNGVCSMVFGACPNPGFCGGIAGFPCPPGFTCIDDPSDECDPNNGGADCGGQCVRQDEPQKCGGLTGAGCPDGYECADAPNDSCEPAEGADCPGFCRPASSTECASDADCPVIGAPCMMCDDGTAACPRSFCADGKCMFSLETCGDKR